MVMVMKYEHVFTDAEKTEWNEAHADKARAQAIHRKLFIRAKSRWHRQQKAKSHDTSNGDGRS